MARHRVLATFTLGNGLKYTCGRSQGADVVFNGVLPGLDQATATTIIEPALPPPSFPAENEVITTEGGRDTQFDEVVLLADWNPPKPPESPVLWVLAGQSTGGSQPRALKLEGDGHGGFEPGDSILPPPGANSTGMSIVPFTGSAQPDISLLNPGSDNIAVYPSDGAGGYNAPILSALGSMPGWGARAFVSGDFNGDKKWDIAIISSHDPNSAGSLSIFKGSGDGHFSPFQGPFLADRVVPSALSVGIAPTALVTGDFNGDSRLDIAVANGGSGDVTVFLGDGSGGFSTSGTFRAGTSPSALAAADLNGDGKLDLVVANQGDDSVTVLLGDGTGHFASPFSSIPAGTGPAALAIADFNGDGNPDVAVADGGSNTVTILLGDGSGFLGSNATYQVATAPSSLVVVDLDGDGKPDLAVGCKKDATLFLLLTNPAPITRPKIIQAARSGKQLLVTGTGFDSGAMVLLNGHAQRTANDSQNPTTSLVAKKAGKKVQLGDVVQVQNSTGVLSQWFIFPN